MTNGGVEVANSIHPKMGHFRAKMPEYGQNLTLNGQTSPIVANYDSTVLWRI
jgi:hypothetical protein